MIYLFKNVKVLDSKSKHHAKEVDILVRKDVIEKIDSSINHKDAQVVDMKGFYVSPGWIDACSNFRDPGFEHKETLQTGANAALRGGFTQVAIMPQTQPVLSGKTQIEYIINQSKTLPIQILPIGSISQKMDGENLSEMYDMHLSGAVAFSDYKNEVNAGLLSRALLYAKNFGGIIMSFPYDPTLAIGGMMHEGIVSTSLGLKGIPEIAEEVMVNRDISLAHYNETSIHFIALSSESGLQAVKNAKKNKIKVSAQVAAHQLYFTDEDLKEFDTNLKVLPPLRSRKMIEKLIQAINDDTITCIVSDHCPEDVESKKLEFDHAEFGMSTIENVFPAINYACQGKVKLEKLVDKLTHEPRELLKLPIQKIEEGQVTSLTFFEDQSEWKAEAQKSVSKGVNNPYDGKMLKGKIKAVYTKSNLHQF